MDRLLKEPAATGGAASGKVHTGLPNEEVLCLAQTQISDWIILLTY